MSNEQVTVTPYNPDQPIGTIVYCSSDEHNGADVGMLLRLSESDFLWCGEITRAEAEAAGVSDRGWHIMHHTGTERHHVAANVDSDGGAAMLETIAARLATQSPSSDIEAEKTRQFNAGYLIAVSNLMNLHGAETEAADVLAELGVTEGALRQMDFTDYDAKPLRKLFRDISRRRKHDKRSAALKETPNVG